MLRPQKPVRRTPWLTTYPHSQWLPAFVAVAIRASVTEPVLSVPTSAVDGELGSRSILSRRRRDAVLVLFEFPGQAEKTSYQIFVLSLQLGIVNLFRFLAKHLSQPFTLRALVHDLRSTREPIEAFPLSRLTVQI